MVGFGHTQITGGGHTQTTLGQARRGDPHVMEPTSIIVTEKAHADNALARAPITSTHT